MLKNFTPHHYVALLTFGVGLLFSFLLFLLDPVHSLLFLDRPFSDWFVFSMSLIVTLVISFYLFYSANYTAHIERVKQEIYESEQRYKLLSALAFDYAFSIRVNPNKTLELDWLTGNFSEFMNFSGKNVTNSQISTFVHPENNILGKKILKELLEGQDSIFETKLLGKDNSSHWLKIFCKSIKNSNSQVTHIYCVAQNITQQKEAEVNLTKIASEQKAIFETLPDVLFRLDNEDIIIDYKASSKDKFYIPSEYVIGRKPKDVMPENIVSKIETAIKDCRNSHSPTSVEYWLSVDNVNSYYEARLIPFSNQEILAVVRDITNRKQAEDALRESQDRFSSIISSAIDAIITIDQNQNITLFNEAAEFMFLCPAKEAIGKQITFFIPSRFSGMYKNFIDEFGQMATSQTSKDLKAVKGLRFNGEEFSAEVSISKNLSKGEKFYTIILRDITEKKKARQILLEKSMLATLEAEIGALLSQSNTLSEILDKAVEIIANHLPTAQVRIWTHNLENLPNIKADSQKQTQENLALSKTPKMPTSRFNTKQILQDKSVHFTNSLLNDPAFSDKEWIKEQGLVSYAGYPLMVEGKIVGVLALFSKKPLSEFISMSLSSIAAQIARGIERLNAQEALKESESRFRQLTEYINEVFYLVDLTDSNSPKLLYVSPAYDQIWGEPSKKLLNDFSSFIEWIHPEDKERIAGVLALLAQGKILPQIEYRIVRADKEVRWILDRTFPIKDAQGKIYRMAGVAEDITSSKQAEFFLREINETLEEKVKERTLELESANKKLAQAARLKDEFLASMSHELRTPLTGILSLSEALQEEVYGSLNEKQLKSLNTIETSGRHLLELINDILDLSKIEAGQLELQNDDFLVEEICQNSLHLIKGMANKKQHTLSFSIEPKGIMLSYDPRRLKQILVNLLSNAVKFTPEKGSVGLEITADPNTKKVIFCVWDTGIGINENNIPKLFQPFTQLDSSLSRQYSGTGLGLSLVKRMVEIQGGSIDVESTLGKGSRFTVTLPWDNKIKKPTSSLNKLLLENPKTKNSTIPSDDSPLILLAEDNEVNIVIFSEYLQNRGYKIEVARDGNEALNLTKKLKPSLILMDIQMPKVSGLEVTQEIRASQDKEIAEIPIIALTALAMTGDKEKCLQSGANDYLSKPVTLNKLIYAIEEQTKKLRTRVT
jgi:PAS domain S-box-containing protein